MLKSFATASLLAPLVVSVAHAQSFGFGDNQVGSDPFAFDSQDLDTIRYSRISSGTDNADESTNTDTAYERRFADIQTEFSLSLRPAKPKFSLKNGFGLNMFSHAQPEMAVESTRLGPNRLSDSIPHIHQGFAYSAGVKVEHEDEDIDGTAYVSSGLLGLSYGRLGRLWYGGVDVNVEQFVNVGDNSDNSDNVLKVDFTTGRRLGWTGTSAGSPLWMLSVQGNLDLQSHSNDDKERGDWYLNPSLFWKNPGFTFSAQVQVPVEVPSSDSNVEPDYRLRAVFEKQF